MNIFGAIRSWNNVRHTRNELSGLSGHQLEDIGVIPGDIKSIAKRAQRS